MQKETIKIVIVGHVDHGKSTLIGRLLLETNSLPKEKIEEIKKISKELGKEAELAYLTDQLKEERTRNITIDTTQIFFKSKKRNFVIIDTPGHVEFLKNMITGTTQAEAAILIVDAHEGIKEQTKRHAILLNLLGIKKIIVILNKMDLINYNKARFDEIKSELIKFLNDLQLSPLAIIPISAIRGDLINNSSSNMPWHKGPTLLNSLDKLAITNNHDAKPLRFPIQDIYEIEGEKILAGKIVSGTLKQGQKAMLIPEYQEITISSIKTFGKKMNVAQAGSNIGLTLRETLPIKRGNVITQKESPINLTQEFEAKLFWLSNKPLKIDTTVKLRISTQEVSCRIKEIKQRVNTSNLEIIEAQSKKLGLNEMGIVSLQTTQPIIIENFSFIEDLGRFIIEENHILKGAGIIAQ